MAELTPMMQQYFKIKSEHPDCLLFFRLGDFYEMFHEDAKIGSEELSLTLTTRDRNKPPEEQVPMCGVPYHAVDSYIGRLMRRGYKVAICEQMEDPATAKGLVDRDIIRIVTPGTVMESAMLEEKENNYICAVYLDAQEAAAALCDLSTGEFLVTAFTGEDRVLHLINELGRFSPRQAVLDHGAWSCAELTEALRERMDCFCEDGGEQRFRPDAAWETLEAQFRTGLETLPQGRSAPVQAAAALLSYLAETQRTSLTHLTTLTWYTGGQFMELDLTARQTLELTETLRTREKKGTLLWVLDRTRTAMGARLLRAWIQRPLLAPARIERRLEAVQCFVDDPIAREELAHALREVTDLERLMGRIAYGSAGGRDLAALSLGLGRTPALRELIAHLGAPLLRRLCGKLGGLPELCALIDRALVDEPPAGVREGGLIRRGYDPEVDRLRDVIENGAAMVAALEAREREKTGIKTLKVSYNKVFGYYIEVSRAYYDLVPDTYIRKQTLVNCERFITQELKDLEHEILSAQDRITALEYQLFTQVRQAAAERVSDVQEVAAAVAQLDVLRSFAAVAAEGNYCRPAVDLSDRLELRDGRHPVVEKTLKDSLFVPNDAVLDGGGNRLAIITGPNMAGKSTYMRQVALITLMAQMGSFVPARFACIGVVDRVFTRIGASDDLSAGQSTFMVEMSEVAGLLKNATARSLLILDEIGRGTSTYDGMAIARSVLEYCADKKRLGARTLFATHYHELTALEGQVDGVKNYNIAAKKRGDGIVFLRKIVPGGADQSYGIEVAKLAGVPEAVIRRARDILKELESDVGRDALGAPSGPAPGTDQVSLLDLGAAAVAEQLRAVTVETLTPIEAMNLLYELKKKL